MPQSRRERTPEEHPYTVDLSGIFRGEDSPGLDSYEPDEIVARHLERRKQLRTHRVRQVISEAAHAAQWSAQLARSGQQRASMVTAFRKNPRFRPLRILGIGWLVLAIAAGSTGAAALLGTLRAEASTDPVIQTGYYLGTGQTLAVTGLGFQPQLVIIKADTTAGGAVWKSTSMPAGEFAYLGVATANNTEDQIQLDANGFTVQIAPEVNTLNVRYSYIAVAGSNCTSNGYICFGSYTGNTAATQTVTVGFQPDLVWAKRATAVAGNFRTSTMPENTAASMINVAHDSTGLFTTLAGDSFSVGGTNNTNGGRYYFAAFRNLAGFFKAGSYPGNGTAYSVTDVGFAPDMVFVKSPAANAPVFATGYNYGDSSNQTTAAANLIGALTSLNADGFSVGSQANVNTTGLSYTYFAFGGAAAPNPSGSFTMARGSYTGTGTQTSIADVGFAPDLVLIKSKTSAQHVVFSTSLDNNFTSYLSNNAAGFVNAIVSLDANGFTVGTHATVNNFGDQYEWQAFGNASTPTRGARASNFYVGVYTGNAIDGRVIGKLGFSPDLVVMKGAAASQASAWRSSAMPTSTSASLVGAAANDNAGTWIKSFSGDSFTIGSAAPVNTAAGVYRFFAFGAAPDAFAVGSYVGSGTATTTSGVGFQSDLAWTKAATAVTGAHRSSNPSQANTQQFAAAVDIANGITGFAPSGFSLGTAANVNSSGVTYYYVAWKLPTASHAPDQPSGVSPAHMATGVSLAPQLQGSAYHDPQDVPQSDASWQVDDNADFNSPEWTRTAGFAESTTTVNAANGTFANSLDGKTELTHGTTYYWRVRYSNSQWSDWSASRTFQTNNMGVPVNQTPVEGGTVRTLTPSLVASAFSDPEPGHAAAFAQWQINTANAFDAPLYDSGSVTYGATFAVPALTLSNQSSYYWRVRYQGSGEQWSDWSTPTRFFVAESGVTVGPLLSGSTVEQGETIALDAAVRRTDGTALTNPAVTITIYNPAGSPLVTSSTMTLVAGSNGVYRYSYAVPAASGSYLYEVAADDLGVKGYAAGSFQVKTLAADIASVRSDLTDLQASVDDRLGALSDEIGSGTLAAIKAKTDSIDWSDIAGLGSSIDMLVGALIVTQASVDDDTAEADLFLTTLTNPVDHFYRNAVLTFTSGGLKGQSRRIAGYTASTHAVRLDPALTSAPATGDQFTIVAQNVRAEEIGLEVASTTADTRSRVIDIQNRVTAIQGTLAAIDTSLEALQTSINAVRAAQQSSYDVRFVGGASVPAGKSYRARLEIVGENASPADASATPTVTIYDAARTAVVTGATMTRTGEGAYEYVYPVGSGAVSGLWESVATVPLGSATQSRSSYWTVTGSPAQVKINGMASVTIPNIAADVTITNEGDSAQEYQYTWCVVANQADSCTGPSVIDAASAAKLLQPGESFDTILALTVPVAGTYWFKLTVGYGSEVSAAHRSFVATAGPAVPPVASSSGGSETPTTLASLRGQLEANALSLQQVLAAVGVVNARTSGIANLLAMGEEHTATLHDIQNKMADLKAVANMVRRLGDNASGSVVETYMKFNSVELHMLIANPDDRPAKVRVKSYLPEEATKEVITSTDGLDLAYDPTAKAYYVSGEIALGPGESVVRKIVMNDIWIFDKGKLADLLAEAKEIAAGLDKTQYSAQASLLLSDIKSKVSQIRTSQENSYDTPEHHIVVYRQNLATYAQVNDSLQRLKDLLVQSGASQGLLGRIGGIQTFATWGIIIAMVLGFALMAAIIFAMWRNQMMLTAMAMNRMSQEEVQEAFMRRSGKRRRA